MLCCWSYHWRSSCGPHRYVHPLPEVCTLKFTLSSRRPTQRHDTSDSDRRNHDIHLAVRDKRRRQHWCRHRLRVRNLYIFWSIASLHRADFPYSSMQQCVFGRVRLPPHRADCPDEQNARGGRACGDEHDARRPQRDRRPAHLRCHQRPNRRVQVYGCLRRCVIPVECAGQVELLTDVIPWYRVGRNALCWAHDCNTIRYPREVLGQVLAGACGSGAHTDIYDCSLEFPRVGLLLTPSRLMT